MRDFLLFIFLLAFILYFLPNCASIKPPGGGPKDTIPPSLLESIPAQKSLNYRGSNIKLTYNEYLKIENLLKQLIITPIIDSEYDVTQKKYSIELKFDTPFKDSTTYTFNFQESIQDITEGNVTLDNVLAFSTTNYIDSMSVFGTVREIFSGQKVESYTVCLYEFEDTLDIFNSPPMYLAKTNKEGIYKIENIKTGIYKIYAYDDQNSNMTCDVPREMYGFKSDSIYLFNDIDSIHLGVLYNDIRELKITRTGTAGKYYEIKLNKNISDYNITSLDPRFVISSNYGGDNRTIRLYDTVLPADSVPFIFNAYDSVGNMTSDTLHLKFTESKRKYEDFNFTIKPKTGSKISDHLSTHFKLTKPIKEIIADSIYFKYDSTTIQSLPDTVLFSFNDLKDEFSFDVKLNMYEYMKKLKVIDSLAINDSTIIEKGSGNKGTRKPFELKFILGKGAIISVENDSIPPIEYSYKPIIESELGIISGKVNSAYESFKIQLLKSKKEIIQEIDNSKDFVFINVDPGEYTIRILIDENNNGKWDSGNILQNIEPEGVYFFNDPITLRANWEITDINLDF